MTESPMPADGAERASELGLVVAKAVAAVEARIIWIDGQAWIPRPDVAKILGLGSTQVRRAYEQHCEHRLEPGTGRYLYRARDVETILIARRAKSTRVKLTFTGVDAENMRRLCFWFIRLAGDVAPTELVRLAKRTARGGLER